MANIDFGRTGVNGLACPICQAPLQANLNDVAASATVLCPNGHEVKLNTGSNEMSDALTDLNKAMNDFGKTTIKIRL